MPSGRPQNYTTLTDVTPIDPAPIDPAPASEEVWDIREKGETYTCTVLPVAQLGGAAKPGPLLIEEGTTTIFVPAGWSARRDPQRNVILEPGRP
jgi:N-methylhydantoinase A/oxoprolinase/acetone carboxylase beta subunit